MKKFLPFIIFIVVFASVLGGQVLFKIFSNDSADMTARPEYLEYEKLFLHGSYKAVDGNLVEMSKLNSPVVIYNFWASWCIPCLEEMPSMIALKKKFPDDAMKIIAINTDEDEQLASIQKTVEKIKLKDEFIIVPDKKSAIVNQFKITAIPVTIIFHRGKVVHFSNGPMDFSAEEIVEKMKWWTEN